MRLKDVEQLYTEHGPTLFRFLVYQLCDRVEAEDVLADTFERALTARRRFDPRRGAAKTWLYSIALNLVRDRARRRAAEASATDRVGARVEEASTRDIERADDRASVTGAVARLSDDEREAIALRFGADLTLEGIARIVHEPRTTVEARVYRALRKLRAELDDID
jgi:RNA polymerase sigma factor (sigma-70 family)